MNFASIAAALAVLGLTTTAAAQTASSPGEVRIALTDQRFALDRLAADQPQGERHVPGRRRADHRGRPRGDGGRPGHPHRGPLRGGHRRRSPAGGRRLRRLQGAGVADSPMISPLDGLAFHTVYRFPSARTRNVSGGVRVAGSRGEKPPS